MVLTPLAPVWIAERQAGTPGLTISSQVTLSWPELALTVTDVVDHGFIRSIYFTDPNGIALEASWWTLDATGRPADFGDQRLFADPDPVPAVRELRESGRLASTPQTRLA